MSIHKTFNYKNALYIITLSVVAKILNDVYMAKLHLKF